jgi:hypothetical protein
VPKHNAQGHGRKAVPLLLCLYIQSRLISSWTQGETVGRV